MAGTPNPFMEDTDVGGLPCFANLIRNSLPKSKKKREFSYRIQMVLLTYVTYALFNMCRRPISIVKSKIIDECNTTFGVAEGKHLKASNSTWCDEAFLVSTTEEFLGFMDSAYVFSYGACLYMSGVIADSYNPRFYLTIGCLLSGFCCALLGLAYYWTIKSFKFLGAVLILFGATQSTGWPVVLSSVTHWYSGEKRGMFFGFWNTHNYIGSILGIYLAGIWVDSAWMWSFFTPGFILAFMGILVYSCFVVDPKDLKELEKEPTKKSSGRRLTQKEIPPWLSGNQSIKMYDAWMLPGVIEFSACMFFSRMVGYMFLYWLPIFIRKSGYSVSITTAAYYAIAYTVGGSIGGIFSGILVDLFRRSAVVCAFFLIVSIPILLLGQISDLGKDLNLDFPITLAMGIFVEAPYIVISTSISADLSKHKLIKRNHRALSTLAGIIEGSGAIGAAIGTFICGIILAKTKWTNVLYLMMGLQGMAILCLSRQAYKDFFRKQKTKSISEYWKAPAF